MRLIEKVERAVRTFALNRQSVGAPALPRVHRGPAALRLFAAAVVVAYATPALSQQVTHGEPSERLRGVTIERGQVRVDHSTVAETIVTRPLGARGRQPAVFIVGWLSCDPVTIPDAPGDGHAEIMRALIERAGAVVMRMEKPRPEASRAGNCEALDFEREEEAYRRAWRTFRRRADVDSTRIVVVGLSNGAAVAPLVAPATEVAGYVAAGGWVKTWYEHMLEFERRRMELRSGLAGATSDSMRVFSRFYVRMLEEGLSPADIARRYPADAPAWSHTATGLFGRPASFFQQLQRAPVREAWAKVSRPVLALWGEYDWIMGRDDHERIVALARANGADRSSLVVVPNADHAFSEYPSVDAMRQGAPGRASRVAIEAILRFVGDITRMAPTKNR